MVGTRITNTNTCTCYWNTLITSKIKPTAITTERGSVGQVMVGVLEGEVEEGGMRWKRGSGLVTPRI